MSGAGKKPVRKDLTKIEYDEPSEMDLDEPEEEKEKKEEEGEAVERGLPMARQRTGFAPPASYLPLPLDSAGATDWIANYLLEHPDVTVQQIKGYLLTLGNGLSLRTSLLPNAGLGVFLDRPAARGTALTYYYGVRLMAPLVLMLELKYRRERVRSHSFRLNLFWTILGNFIPNPGLEGRQAAASPVPIRDPQHQLRGHGLAGWMNTLTKKQHDEEGMRFNVAFRVVYDSHITPVTPGQGEAHLDALLFYPNHQIVVAVALRDIQPGEELLVDYGEFYLPERLEEKK
jgi:hypothetical protein